MYMFFPKLLQYLITHFNSNNYGSTISVSYTHLLQEVTHLTQSGYIGKCTQNEMKTGISKWLLLYASYSGLLLLIYINHYTEND